MSGWHKLRLADVGRIRDVQVQLVHAAQLVAAVGHSLAEPRDDDSHTAMRWQSADMALLGAEIPGERPFVVALRLNTLTLVLIDESGMHVAEYGLHGTSKNQALGWLSDVLGKPITLIEYSYDPLPDHDVARGGTFNAGDTEAFAESIRYFDNAEFVIEELWSEYLGASVPVVWPHHFDMASEIPVPEAEKPGTTIGIGLCTVDETYDTPYWYVAAYPYLDPHMLPELPGPGGWNTNGKWVGAALTILDGIQNDSGEQQLLVQEFFTRAIAATRDTIKK
jgi:hypothetical protein